VSYSKKKQLRRLPPKEIQPINAIFNNNSEIHPSIANIEPHEIKFDIQNSTERRNSVNSYL
jgi:hypothetical protein